MPKHNYLKVSDCDLPPAEKFPGKKYRQNPFGSVQFDTKGDWVENEILIWYEHMRSHAKYDNTAISQKAHILKKHLKKLNVSISEARQILVRFEEANNCDTEEDEEEEEEQNEDDSETEDMDVEGDNRGGQIDMETDDGGGSQDMFANSEDEIEDEEASRVKLDAMIEKYMSKPMQEIISDESNIPKFVLSSRRYKSKKEDYINSYINTELEGMSSQEVYNNFTQIPSYITESEAFKLKLDTMPNSKKSEKRILKNLNETLDLLRESETPEAKQQRKIITSAMYDPRFGFPKINETRSVKQAGRDLKTKLRSGESSDLTPEKGKRADYFPESVKKIAENCWRQNCTVIEPGKHSRPKAAIKDGGETIPAIYQTLTDKEAFATFEDIYKQEVTEAIKAEFKIMREKLNNYSDTKLKQRKLEFILKKEERFPSMAWFMHQRPKETKTRSDHCTGLCRNCEEPQLNYETIRKFKKSLCYCNSKRCPSWFCLCDLDDNGEVPDECDCETCSCDKCQKCQVNRTY